MFPNVSLPWGEDGCRDPRVLDAAVAHHFGLSLGMVRSLRCFFSFLFHRFSSFNSWTRIHPDVVYVCLYTQTLPRPGYPMNSSRQNQIANGDTTSGICRFPILRGWNCENCWHVSTVFQVSLSLSDVWAALPPSPVAFMVLAHLLYGNACAKGRWSLESTGMYGMCVILKDKNGIRYVDDVDVFPIYLLNMVWFCVTLHSNLCLLEVSKASMPEFCLGRCRIRV